MPGWNVRYILCRWVDAVKNMFSTLKTWLKRVWSGDGDSPPDYTFHSSEMRGELDKMNKDKQNKKDQNEDPSDKIRKAGW